MRSLAQPESLQSPPGLQPRPPLCLPFSSCNSVSRAWMLTGPSSRSLCTSVSWLWMSPHNCISKLTFSHRLCWQRSVCYSPLKINYFFFTITSSRAEGPSLCFWKHKTGVSILALPFTSCVILNSVSSWLKTIPSPRIIKKIGQIVHVNYFSMIVLIQNLFSLGEHFSPFSILSSLNFSLHLVNGCSFSATCLIQLVSCQPCSAMPWTAAPQAPLSVGFPRQECGSGWRFPSAGGLPKSGITPMPPVFAALQADSYRCTTRAVQRGGRVDLILCTCLFTEWGVGLRAHVLF